MEEGKRRERGAVAAEWVPRGGVARSHWVERRGRARLRLSAACVHSSPYLFGGQ
jgi:hypothetical protein